MRVLVTGTTGQLGSDVYNELIKRFHDAIACDRNSFDLTDSNSVNNTINRNKPEAVIHCAAWTDVDSAEKLENKELVYAINADGTKYLAEACRNNNAKMLYISTDYVFDGSGNKPWHPDEYNLSPLNNYGESKMIGENNVTAILDKFFILRTSWLYGKNGKNFINTIINASKNNHTLKVVNDQFGRPTYTKDLAKIIVDMIESEKYGFYHATNEGEYISWYDLSLEIINYLGIDTEIIPVSTKEYGLNIAIRPHNSRLNNLKLSENGFNMLPNWKDALHRYLSEVIT